MDFQELKVDKRVVDILSAHGITKPTEIQVKTYPLAANGYEVIGVSQTGSGKTLAFVLPIISQILASNRPFHTLIISPTREVAKQIAECVDLFAPLEIKYALLLGGEPITPQAQALSKKCQIVIGTPGRIAKHITKTKSFKICYIRKLVLDEADRFFESDFLDDLELISKKLVKKSQTLMFTATLTEKTKKLAHLFMKAPRFVNLAGEYSTSDTVSEYLFLVPEKYKLVALRNFLKKSGASSAIVFVGMCAMAKRIGALLNRCGVVSQSLHGSMPQEERLEVVSRFRQGSFCVLVATDLAGRGLDIPSVELILNYDLPNAARDYTHRIGRTARAGKPGSAVTFVTQYSVGKLQRIEHVLKRKIAQKDFDDYDGNQEVQDVYEEVKNDVSTR